MKSLLRYFLINLSSLWLTTQIIGGLSYSGGIKTLLLGGLAFSIINIILVPLLKILLLPLNLLTLGLFAWITNVLAFYTLTSLVSDFSLKPYFFQGFQISGFIIPPVELTVFWVAIISSFLIGVFTHFLHWLVH